MCFGPLFLLSVSGFYVPFPLPPLSFRFGEAIVTAVRGICLLWKLYLSVLV